MPELVVTLAVHSVRCAENKSPFTFACFILRIDSRAERLHDLLVYFRLNPSWILFSLGIHPLITHTINLWGEKEWKRCGGI